ncbi:DinB family protein [Kordia periserrulae]|uniref:DinB family protein n=1 Tax=Kordia periserrulae TaxID=701523 RepID=A0A2T6C024_9FLAO|nr:DinB family protein [Kordia periserrulae]PTX61597.1 DinB family protein [Kordia periserrulae]
MIPFPETNEYHSYFDAYIQQFKGEDILAALSDGAEDVTELMTSLTEEQLQSAYAEGKWTIKEVLQHIMDTERIFCNRALRIARNDKTNLPGFEQNEYVPYSGANERNSMDMFQEYSAIRQATIMLFKSFTAEMLERIGVASGHEISVRALVYLTAGHEKHHINVINERYL